MRTQPTIKEQLDGFPFFQFTILCIIRLAEPIAFASFLSYIFFMIKSFRIAKTDADVSRYTGYLASAFSISQFLTSVRWGRASDRYGRKPMILLGCLGTAVSMLVFGFSVNFYMALCARAMMGILNGNVSIMRTMAGEIAVEKRHQGIAFSNLSLIWSLGKAGGYFIAGNLVDVDHFRNYKRDNQELTLVSKDVLASTPTLKTTLIPTVVPNLVPTSTQSLTGLGLFKKFPFAFPNVVIFFIILIHTTFGWLFLEETHEKQRVKRDRGLEIGDRLKKICGLKVPDRDWKIRKDEASEYLIGNHNDYSDDEYPEEETDDFEMLTLNANTNNNEEEREVEEEEEMEEQNIGESLPTLSLFTWPIIWRIACNFLISFGNIIYTEFLPVFLAKSVDVDSLNPPFHIKGGFGMNSASTGKMLSITGLTSVIAVSLLFPAINQRFTVLEAFRLGLIIIPVFYFVLPLTIFTIPQYLGTNYDIATPLLYLNGFMISFVGSITFSQVTLLIHRATPKKHRAVINGYTISCTALAKFVSPLIWGFIMTKMDLKGLGGLSWWLLGFVSLAALGVTFLLSENDDQED